MRANAVNLASFANALCHFNTTPLSVAVLAPCAWGENLACSVSWQSVVNSAKRNTARGEFGNETAQHGKIQRHSKASAANSVWQVFASKTTHGKFGLASVAKWAVLADKTKRGDIANSARRKWGSVWAGDFSLSLSLSLVARTCGTPLG